MCACVRACFQRNLVTFAKARPAQMIFITTSIDNIGNVSNISNVHIIESVDSISRDGTDMPYM